MKKYIITTLLGLSMFGLASAQEYKVAKSGGKITLDVAEVTVEGYDGNEVVFKSALKEKEKDPRAKGLRAISGDGYTDNTGLGISVTENGNNLEVHPVGNSAGLKIMVPKNIIVSSACHVVADAGKIEFKNMTNEIEVSADYNEVVLDNVTGPMTVRALYGEVKAKFNGIIKGPVSIASTYGAVDVTVPTETKADVKLSTSFGEILASADLKIVIEKNKADNMISYGKLVNGKINGGGTDFKLTSEYGKIYLRTGK
ncbi:DUF4097 family beta strand repeat-containing protein [Mucilaginibacter sp. dw_454]|uniref:DUF4097 family beta strand repeat-containing protein n=1 Tax=Mucilaginibacter sp. dw_454 TaxID=2720079 RepID=UPI001BD6C8EA|nr:DUF4097 family beta strand repeat-containing protein [Mucilaginibacter sp. dw_454]